MMEVFNAIFFSATVISAIGLIYIIYARSAISIHRKLYVLFLVLVIGYLISHTVHFMIMHNLNVTILDQSCHSFLLLIILVLAFFSFYFPNDEKMPVFIKLVLVIPTLALLYALWSGYIINESHIHLTKYEAHYTKYYYLFLIWYVILLLVSIFFLLRKLFIEKYSNHKYQILTVLIGLIITNFTVFVFGLYLPWVLGFYYLVEVSPLAFFIGVIITTTIAISRFNFFPAAETKLQTFSLNKKVFFAAVIIVPVIILLIQIPLGRILFNINTTAEWQRYFIISLLGGILVSVVMAFIIVKIIANPINKLTNITKEIQQGNYGRLVDVYSSDEIGKLAETFNKMSETLKKDNMELEQRQHKINLLLNAFEKSDAAICAFDLNYNVIEVNSRFAELLNENTDDILNHNLNNIADRDERLHELFSFLRKFQNSNITEDEIKIDLKGNTKFLLVTISPFYQKENKVEGYLMVALDLTNIKQLESQLAKSERLAALGEMAAVLAHEIKTPLTSIKMNNDMLSDSITLDEANQNSMNIINREINRLNNLVKEVLKFARHSELKNDSLDLKELLDELIDQMKNQFEKKNFYVLNKCLKQKIWGDREKLQQIFLNLFENALEASTDNGQLDISCKALNDYFEIYLTDNGKGIKQEMKEKIFEPFYTSKASGTGLGLAIAQKLIEQHNGEIKLLSSHPGETVFVIKFKIDKE